MSTLTELDKVLGMLYDINDTVRSNCGDEAYYALRDAIESVRNAWNVCKRGQEAKLENAYKGPVQSSRKPIKSSYVIKNNFVEKHGVYHNDTWKLEVVELEGNTAILKPVKSDDYFVVKNPEIDEQGDLVWTSDSLPMTDYDTALKEFNYYKDLKGKEVKSSRKPIKSGNEQVNKNLTEEDINKAADYFDITYDEAKRVLSIPNYDVEWDDIPFVVNTVNEFMNGDFSNIESVSYVDEDDWIPILKKPEVEDMFQFRFEGVTKYTMRDGSEHYIGFGGEDDIDVTDYYLKALSENKINSSKNPIKSSLEDRLVPYLEEFEEGYADALLSTDEMGHNARLETFYEIFKNDYNLSDDDISKLEGAVQDIWHETEEENIEHDMGEMYGAPHGATPEEALKHFE